MPSRRWGRAVVTLVLLAVMVTVTAGSALGQPAPPPNPSDDDLARSRERVRVEAAEVARLTARLAELEREADELAAAVAAAREDAEAAMIQLATARENAALAEERARQARAETEAAAVAIEQARSRLDEFVAATYHHHLDLGPLGLLASATSPDDLVARLEFDGAIAETMLAAQRSLERALVDRANTDAAARAARDAAHAAQVEAEAARAAADSAYAAAQAAAREHAERLAAVQAERRAVEQRLAAAEARDATLRAQRDRYRAWLREVAAARTAHERATRDAAAARLSAPQLRPGGPGTVQRVIDRALSQLGVPYVWGGGNGRGPTTGIPDGLGSPLDRVGFDCSGLMVYAFSGVGITLPRVSRYQYQVGRKVPIDQIRPGDMVFYQRGSRPIHHVALYIGNGQMIEAPYTGARVRITPLRRQDLVPYAVRVL